MVGMAGANIGVDCPLVGVQNAQDKNITLRFRLVLSALSIFLQIQSKSAWCADWWFAACYGTEHESSAQSADVGADFNNLSARHRPW